VAPTERPSLEEIMMIRKRHLIGLGLLGLSLLPLPSCAPGGSALQSYAPVAAQAPGTARVWFVRTKDPEEQYGDPLIYANGQQVGRSIPGIAFYHDFSPGTYAFTVQSFGTPTNARDTLQLAPGSQTYLEVLWGGSWLVGSAGGATFFVRTLVQPLGPAYVKMETDQGPPRAL
jgi:hypothetical protein